MAIYLEIFLALLAIISFQTWVILTLSSRNKTLKAEIKKLKET